MLGQTKCTACGSGKAMPNRTTPTKARVVPDVIKVKTNKAPLTRR